MRSYVPALSIIVAAAAVVAAMPVRAAVPMAQPIPPIPAPSLQCRQAVAMMERSAGIPSHLMAAIARIESGRSDGKGGVHPWPWTINVEGAGYTYETKAEAIAAVRQFQAKGARSIDVGCMQVNLMYHPTAFASLEEGFDPVANARYAAKFLTSLYEQSKDWTKATALYHSATPDLGTNYQRKVFTVLPDEQSKGAAFAAAGGNVWSNNVWSNNVWTARGPAMPQPGPAAQLPPTGGYLLSNRADNARVIAAPEGKAGRDLSAYRSSPVQVSSRILPGARL